MKQQELDYYNAFYNAIMNKDVSVLKGLKFNHVERAIDKFAQIEEFKKCTDLNIVLKDFKNYIKTGLEEGKDSGALYENNSEKIEASNNINRIVKGNLGGIGIEGNAHVINDPNQIDEFVNALGRNDMAEAMDVAYGQGTGDTYRGGGNGPIDRDVIDEEWEIEGEEDDGYNQHTANRPQDCYFSIQYGSDIGVAVLITPISYFEENNCLSDWNGHYRYLNLEYYCLYELADSFFEFDSPNMEEAFDRLTEFGFVYNEEFNNLFSSETDGESESSITYSPTPEQIEANRIMIENSNQVSNQDDSNDNFADNINNLFNPNQNSN